MGFFIPFNVTVLLEKTFPNMFGGSDELVQILLSVCIETELLFTNHESSMQDFVPPVQVAIRGD